MTDDPRINGVRVRELREALKLTQTQAAARAEMKQQQWSAIERVAQYNGTIDTVSRVARALGVDLPELQMVDVPLPVGTLEEGGGVSGDVGASRTWRWVRVWGEVPDEAASLTPERTLLLVEADMLQGAGRLIAVRVTTDELHRFVQKGEHAVIDVDRPWTDGRVHLFDLDGRRLLRQVRVKADVLHILEPCSTEEDERVESVVPAKRVKLHGVALLFVPREGSRPAP